MVVVGFWDDSFSVALVVLDQVQRLGTQHRGHLGYQVPAILLCHPHECLPVVLHLGPALHTRCSAWRSLLHLLCALGWQANQSRCSTASADSMNNLALCSTNYLYFVIYRTQFVNNCIRSSPKGGQFSSCTCFHSWDIQPHSIPYLQLTYPSA